MLAIALPVYHSGISAYAHTGILKSGQCAYILRIFDVEKLLATVEKYQVTDIPIVPVVTKAIVMSPHTKRYSMHSVQSAFGGSAPCSKELQQQLLSLFGGEGKSMTQLYGMTESTVVATRFWHPENDETGSVGRLIPNVESKYVQNLCSFGIYIPGPIVTVMLCADEGKDREQERGRYKCLQRSG